MWHTIDVPRITMGISLSTGKGKAFVLSLALLRMPKLQPEIMEKLASLYNLH